jgi:hypothetical protein
MYAVTKLTKVALKQSSHLLVTLVDAPENSRNAVIEHQKYKRFLGEDSRPSYFPHKSLTCWGNGKEGKFGASKGSPKEIRVGEPNILSCLKCKLKFIIY